MGFVGGGDTVQDHTPLPGVPQTPQFFLTELKLPGARGTTDFVLRISLENLKSIMSGIIMQVKLS